MKTFLPPDKNLMVKRKALPKMAKEKYAPYMSLDFSEIDQRAKNLADVIETRFEDLAEILLGYESYEVVTDEVARTLDLLRHLKENKKYFRLRVGAVVAFLPRNQPLYTFVCFVVVPSLMASEVHFRIPKGMRDFFPEVLALLDIHELFPNIFVSKKTRLEFLKDQSALFFNPETKESKPVTDVVIFTGISVHADQLRTVFDKRVLFIANGAGNNPIVISKDADLAKATEAVLTIQFYNQGQDCAAPNAILVHKDILQNLLRMLRDGIRDTKVGHYKDRLCRIGPISDPKDLVKIQDFLIENRQWLDSSTLGIIRTSDAIIEPTIICKPLVLGGNFSEIFAPIIFVQEYENDFDLARYFEDPHYAQNAMYISLYGKSKYVESLINRPIGGKILHDKKSIFHNIHLHARGIERGTQPYGGYGYGASSIRFNGKIIAMPTLPQRDIYERIARPIIAKKSIKAHKAGSQKWTKIKTKDVEKLLKLKNSNLAQCQNVKNEISDVYFDLHSIETNSEARYVKIGEEYLCRLLEKPNAEYIAGLESKDMELIDALKKLLSKKSAIPRDEFKTALYSIAKKPNESETQNKKCQQHFFGLAYQLLFGTESGPRLAPFLFDAEEEKINYLLDA